mmetsp:Transcript_10115/g.33697  ORF Transcript_10115/g.33697 Transcript_10115/m.33697 type:complete len:556 (-) Transcript_10115:3592-5259(-)
MGGEDVDDVDVLPKSLAILGGGKSRSDGAQLVSDLFDVVLHQEEMRRADPARYLGAPPLRLADHHDLLPARESAHVDRPVVHHRHHQHGCQCLGLCANHDGHVGRAVLEVSHPDCQVLDPQLVARRVVQLHTQPDSPVDGLHALSVEHGRPRQQSEVAPGHGRRPVPHRLHGRVVNGSWGCVRHRADDGDAASDCRGRARRPVLLVGGARVANMHVHVDEARERDCAVGSAAVDDGADGGAEAVLEDGLDEDLGALDVRDERDRVEDSHGAGEVALGVVGGWTAEPALGWDVDDEAELALLEVELGTSLTIGGEIDGSDLEVVFEVEVSCPLAAEELVSQLDQQPHGGQEVHLVPVGADREEDGFGGWGSLEARGEERLEVRLVPVLTEARYLSCAHHVNAHLGIAAGEAVEGELSHLYTHPVGLTDRQRRRDSLGDAHEDPGGYGDEGEVKGLGDEGEGAGGADVALDDLQLVVLGHELHVEGSRDEESLRYCKHDVPDALQRPVRQVLSRRHDGCVSGVNTSVLHVLRDHTGDDDAVLGNGIHLDLLGVLDEL